MGKFATKRSDKAGLPPGSLVYVGEEQAAKAKITVMDYDEHGFEEKEVANIEDCFVFKTKPSVTWINIDGLNEPAIIEKIGAHFEVHPLTLEDIMNTNQRPKFEDQDSYMFIVLKMLSYNTIKNITEYEQVCFLVGTNFVISLQETVGSDVFDAVRERIRTAKGRIRKLGPDYLVYSLIDAVVDNYFFVLERLGEGVEFLQMMLIEEPNTTTLNRMHRLKRDLIFLRKSVWPLRELVSGMQRSESPLISKTTHTYLRDIYDHTVQIIDSIESFRDIVSSMMDIYLSSISNRINSVMKVLTIISTLFMPLTFITSLYGMNFKHMPELQWKYGYAMVWGIIITMVTVMLIIFHKKKWL